MARTPGTELYEYMPPSAGVREPEQGGPAFPYYLSDRPRPGAAGGNGGVPRGPDTNLRAIGKVITAGTIAGMLFGAPIWGKPILSLARYPNAKNPLDLIAKAIDVISAWLKPRINHLSHDLSKGSVHLNGDLTHTLDLLAVRLDQMVLNQAYVAADIPWAIGKLVHFKIPHTVKHFIRPIELKVGHVVGTTIRLTIRIRNVEKYVVNKIEKPIKREIREIRKTIRTTVIRPIRTIEREVRTIRRTVVRHDMRIKQLTFILVPALATAWLVKTLIRAGLRYTTCQNVKDFGNELCASPPGTGRNLARFFKGLPTWLLTLLPLLLNALWDVLLILDFCNMTKAMISVAQSGPVEAALRSFVEGVDDLIACQGVDVVAEMQVPAVGYPPAQAHSGYVAG